MNINQLRRRVVRRIKLGRRFGFHFAIVIGFLGCIAILSCWLLGSSQEFTNTWGKDLQPLTCSDDGKTDLVIHTSASSPANGAASVEQGKRLSGQFKEVQGRINHHFHLLAHYYKYYFATIVVSGVLAAVAAIVLLFITSDGWKLSNQYARTVFLVSIASATFCAAFPSIFQHQQHIDDNWRLYVGYVALGNEICSYGVTGENVDGEDVTPADFIHGVDLNLSRLNTISVGFDFSKIPDFNAAFKQGTGASAAAPDTTDRNSGSSSSTPQKSAPKRKTPPNPAPASQP